MTENADEIVQLTYADIKSMYNDVVVEFNELQTENENLEHIVTKAYALVKDIRNKAQRVSTEYTLSVESSAHLKYIDSVCSEFMWGHDLQEDHENEEQTYKFLFAKNRQDFEDLHGKTRAAVQELEHTRHQKTEIDREIHSLQDTQARLTRKIMEENKALAKLEMKRQETETQLNRARDHKQQLEADAQSIASIIETKTEHFHELQSTIKLEMCKFLQYKTENQKRDEMHSNVTMLEKKSERKIPAVPVDALGRICIEDGLSRMMRRGQHQEPLDDLQVSDQDLRGVFSTLTHIEEVMSETEGRLQAIFDQCDMNV